MKKFIIFSVLVLNCANIFADKEQDAIEYLAQNDKTPAVLPLPIDIPTPKKPVPGPNPVQIDPNKPPITINLAEPTVLVGNAIHFSIEINVPTRIVDGKPDIDIVIIPTPLDKNWFPDPNDPLKGAFCGDADVYKIEVTLVKEPKGVAHQSVSAEIQPLAKPVAKREDNVPTPQELIVQAASEVVSNNRVEEQKRVGEAAHVAARRFRNKSASDVPSAEWATIYFNRVGETAFKPWNNKPSGQKPFFSKAKEIFDVAAKEAKNSGIDINIAYANLLDVLGDVLEGK